MKTILFAARGTLLFLFVLSLAAEAAEVKFFAGGGFRSVMTELAPAFERATGHKVVATWDSTGGLQKRINAGESFDVLFIGPEIFRQARHRQETSSRRKRFEVQSRPETEPLHKCATCGATELTDPSLEFRVARDGEEYCLAHLPRPANASV